MLTVKQFTFNPIQENTYVIYNDKGECIIVDPGCYFPAERNDLKEFIDENALVPKYLLNTHCHLDHVFGNKWVHETWGLELHLHLMEQPVFDRATISGDKWGIPFENYKGPFHYMEAGTEIILGENRLRVLFTPGHSPGSVSFYCPEDGFVIAGDVLFKGSVGRTDLPGGDFDRLAQSIKEELYVLPDETVVYSGHGDETTIGREKKENAFVRYE
ncbi:MAG: MBL fold metallo-hydrolase [Chitinophagaceae bacterium]|nr:MAG: MBL fold metallo-hydrolase [Chitinophagaceae bacterium]